MNKPTTEAPLAGRLPNPSRQAAIRLAVAHLRNAKEARIIDRDPSAHAFYLDRAAAARAMLTVHDDDDSADLARSLSMAPRSATYRERDDQ
jgi:hypothetical protein